MVRYLPRSKCCRKTTRPRAPCAYYKISSGQANENIFISDSEDDEIGSDSEEWPEQATPSAKASEDEDMAEEDVSKAQADIAGKSTGHHMTLRLTNGEEVEDGQNGWRLANRSFVAGHVSDEEEEDDELEALGVKELRAVQESCQLTP